MKRGVCAAAVRAYDDLLFDYLISVSVKRVGNAPGLALLHKSKHLKTAFFVCFARKYVYIIHRDRNSTQQNAISDTN